MRIIKLARDQRQINFHPRTGFHKASKPLNRLWSSESNTANKKRHITHSFTQLLKFRSARCPTPKKGACPTRRTSRVRCAHLFFPTWPEWTSGECLPPYNSRTLPGIRWMRGIGWSQLRRSTVPTFVLLFFSFLWVSSSLILSLEMVLAGKMKSTFLKYRRSSTVLVNNCFRLFDKDQ